MSTVQSASNVPLQSLVFTEENEKRIRACFFRAAVPHILHHWLVSKSWQLHVVLDVEVGRGEEEALE